jgi:hypothetical protein
MINSSYLFSGPFNSCFSIGKFLQCESGKITVILSLFYPFLVRNFFYSIEFHFEYFIQIILQT